MGGREVELGARESQRFTVSCDEPGVRQRAVPRELEQLRDAVDPDHLAHERRERKRERAGSRTDVESSFVAARPDEVAYRLREPRRAVVLMRGETLCRVREALSS